MYQMPPPDKVTSKLPVDRWHGERCAARPCAACAARAPRGARRGGAEGAHGFRGGARCAALPFAFCCAVPHRPAAASARRVCALHATPLPGPAVTAPLTPSRPRARSYMRFGPDGLLYVSIGAPCDVCEERKANTGLTFSSIYTLDISQGDNGWRTFATGACGWVGKGTRPQGGAATPSCIMALSIQRGWAAARGCLGDGCVQAGAAAPACGGGGW